MKDISSGCWLANLIALDCLLSFRCHTSLGFSRFLFFSVLQIVGSLLFLLSKLKSFFLSLLSFLFTYRNSTQCRLCLCISKVNADLYNLQSTWKIVILKCFNISAARPTMPVNVRDFLPLRDSIMYSLCPFLLPCLQIIFLHSDSLFD